MKRIALIALLLTGLAVAGQLKSSPDFARSMMRSLNVTEIPCPSDLIAIQDVGYLCSTYPSQLTADQIKLIWERDARENASSLTLAYETQETWHAGNGGERIRYFLNRDLNGATFVQVAGSEFISFSSRAGYGSSEITAVPATSQGFRGVMNPSRDPAGPDLDCIDFSSQAEAQQFFALGGGLSNDAHRLDGDNDGEACELNEPWSTGGTGRAQLTQPSTPPIVITPPTAPIVISPPPPPAVTPPAPSNAGKCWVNGYRRKDGTYVNGYWRNC